LQRLDQPAPTIAGPRDLLRRLTRWLNLTLIHQATWPVVVLLTGSVMQRPASSSVGDILGMVIGPLAACLLGLHYLGDRRTEFPAAPVRNLLADQVRLIIVGLPIMLFIGRIVTVSVDSSIKVMVVGLANVAAYHVIHFGVVPGIFKARYLVPLLFGLSWAIHQIADALARDTGGSFILHALGGFTVGALVALASMMLHRWPGGRWTAPAAQLLVIYMIFGFAT
jgi:hypothetical protein